MLRSQAGRAEKTVLGHAEMATLRPPVQKAIEGLAAVPTDIAPQFVTADAMGRAPAKIAKKK